VNPLVFRTRANGGAVLATIGNSLAALGYSIVPRPDGWGGRAEVGSAKMRVLVGGFARWMLADAGGGAGAPGFG
jgi:hypothetical protein